MNYSEWRDPITGAFSIERNSTGRSCDNHVLFTAEAFALKLISLTECEMICAKFEATPGILSRYPGSPDLMAHDDYIGLSSVSKSFAKRAFFALEATDWVLDNGNYIGRMPLLEPTIRSGAGLQINMLNSGKALSQYIWDALQPASDTNGRLLLWIAQQVLYRDSLRRSMIKTWRDILDEKYPNGFSQMASTYFQPKDGVEHPFTLTGKNDFT